MKILFDNVNFKSRSGPNSFGRKLSNQFLKNGHEISVIPEKDTQFDAQLSFIAASCKVAPIIQRLDGIYFNSDQDFIKLNQPIEATYALADAVIFQSNFNKMLTEHHFGKHKNSAVIHNGTDMGEINKIQEVSSDTLDTFDKMWCCASSWRPHKRLSENVRYFLEYSGKNDCLVIAGENPDVRISNPRIFYAGDLEWSGLIGLYKRSDIFLHLAWLDHCPNVVIDARACNLHIICSSSGGTKEIAGINSTIIEEEEWDFSPTRLYHPPKMNFSNRVDNSRDSDIDISNVYEKYLSAIGSVV